MYYNQYILFERLQDFDRLNSLIDHRYREKEHQFLIFLVYKILKGLLVKMYMESNIHYNENQLLNN